MFIELTDKDTKKHFLVNVKFIETVKPWGDGTKIAFSYGFSIVIEDYDFVCSMIYNKERDFSC
jgi:hypothetical protein